jgi:heme exporter protein D
MWTPDWLYAKLPLLYLLAGALCVWALGPSTASMLSALSLVMACVLTVLMRRTARGRMAAQQRRRRSQR